MPRFLHSKSALLNDLAAPKKRVTKNLKKTYQGTESTIGQKLEETEAFDGVYSQMVGIIASVNEINNQFALGPAISDRGLLTSGAAGRLAAPINSVLTKLKGLLLFFSRNVKSMSIFNAPQIEQLNNLNSQLVAEFQQTEQLTRPMTPAVREKFAKGLSVFAQDLSALQLMLSGKQTPEAVFKLYSDELALGAEAERAPGVRRARVQEEADFARAAMGRRSGPVLSGRWSGRGGYSPELNDLIGGAFPSNLLAKPLIGSNPNTWTPLQYRTKVDVGLPMGGYTPTRFL
jgi:hypothetical protein